MEAKLTDKANSITSAFGLGEGKNPQNPLTLKQKLEAYQFQKLKCNFSSHISSSVYAINIST